MKILFYGTKNYDEEFFEKLLPSYPGITIKFTEANIHEETASLAKGYEAICAFVNADLSTPVIEELNAQGVKLVLMRCAGYNNVDLETAHKFGMKVMRVPGYSPEAVAEHAMALALTANRHTHKAYIKCRENNFSLSGLMGLNFYQKTAGIIGTGKIGQAMAKICKGFGMRVIAYDLFPNKSLDYLEYEKERIELLLAGGAGNEEEYEQIVELAKKCPYKVTFLGKLPQKELAKVYNSCDIFALLSFSEGLPLTVIEALACGDRVVMTDLPGVKEWIDTYAPGADIRYVTLPLMRNVDEAVPATLPDFERRIGQRIWESVEAGKTKEVDVSGLSWTKIAGEVLKVLSLTS